MKVTLKMKNGDVVCFTVEEVYISTKQEQKVATIRYFDLDEENDNSPIIKNMKLHLAEMTIKEEN